MSGKAIFVAGTSTEVGKTVVSTDLCRKLGKLGFKVGVFKPAETGCGDEGVPPDAVALMEASGTDAPLDLVCPYRLKEPLAPAVAADREGVKIDVGRLNGSLDRLRAENDLVVCEGAGGLLVPLAEGLLTADWLRERKIPVLLVAPLALGTINHTLLSAGCLRDRAIPLIGTLLSATSPPSGPAEETNPQVLASFPEIRLLGVVEHGGGIPDEAVRAVAGLIP